MSFKKIKVFLIELLESAVLSLIIILPIRFFIIQPFFVKGQSMEPNFHENDYLIIDELSYRLREPQRGEVVVLRSPFEKDYYFIKRIVGLPGETVSVKNGLVKIFNQANPEGIVLDEVYLETDEVTDGDLEVKISQGEYFVMGDNRRYSYDSRRWGLLKESDLIGRVWLRLWPVNVVKVYAR
ncbi:MAG: Signal peptidase I [Parcubacteria group bacterium GW2011_GWB1_45_10]|nr:MAG: Signal peptidase I [Parcubacteria group bacterium GW2011_GWB1_45_10]